MACCACQALVGQYRLKVPSPGVRCDSSLRCAAMRSSAEPPPAVKRASRVACLKMFTPAAQHGGGVMEAARRVQLVRGGGLGASR